MLSSLSQSSASSQLNADVIVIGAGLSGLLITDTLSKAGLRVVTLESGSEKQDRDTHYLNEVEMLGSDYKGASNGRFRCLGGTSTRWGGALLPYLESDFEAHSCGWHPGWLVAKNDVSRYLNEVENHFGVSHGSYGGGDSNLDTFSGFVPRMPKWPVFKNRSTANVFRKTVDANPNTQVLLDAIVTQIIIKSSKVSGVIAKSLNGNVVKVLSPRVVIAAGAIETTRLLLLLNRAHDDRVFDVNTPLGKGLHDHLSTKVANIEGKYPDELTKRFGFRFVGGGMRNLRYELNSTTRKEEILPAAFFHVAFSREPESGFDGLRNVYQSIQRRQLPRFKDIGCILGDAPWFAQAVRWRYFEKRVLPPTNSSFELHLVTEQAPVPENNIGLSSSKVDPFGLPLATVMWKINEQDKIDYWRSCELVFSSWRKSTFKKIADINPLEKSEVMEELVSGGGVYHPAGTTRIGLNGSEGVVDSQMCVHGVKGLMAVSTSNFPSIGGSSPSLTLMLFSLLVANNIEKDFHKNQQPSST